MSIAELEAKFYLAKLAYYDDINNKKLEKKFNKLKKTLDIAKKAEKEKKTGKPKKRLKVSAVKDVAMSTITEEVNAEEVSAVKDVEMSTKSRNKLIKRNVPPLKFTASGLSLYLTNLCWKITEEQTRQFFEDCGEIIDVSLVTKDVMSPDGEIKTLRSGDGFITFTTRKAAHKAMKKHLQQLAGRKVRIKYAKSPTPPTPPTKTLEISNLSPDLSEKVAIDFFQDCGKILDIHFLKKIKKIKTENFEKFSGKCFITFATQKDADTAIAKNGQFLLNWPIKIEYTQYFFGGRIILVENVSEKINEEKIGRVEGFHLYDTKVHRVNYFCCK